MEATRQPTDSNSATRGAVAKKPTIKMGPTKITFAVKRPLTLKQRMVLAKQAQRFAQQKAEKLAAKAEALAAAGDPGAARMAALAEKAAGNAATASQRVDKITGAVKKKAEYDGASMAEAAVRLAYLKKGLADRQPGGQSEFDSKNLDWYKKEVAKSEKDMVAKQQKAAKLEASFGMPGIVAVAAEKQASDFVKAQQERFNKNPVENAPPPRMEELNRAMGKPPGGIAQEMAEARDAQAESAAIDAAGGTGTAQAGKNGRPGTQEFTRPKGAGPDLGGAGKESKSNLGGTVGPAKPSLQRGDLGGLYYETKSGSRVYVQK